MATEHRKRIYVPTAGVGDWQRLLAKPELHWRVGYSARALAHCWEAARGFPGEIRDLFRGPPAAFDEIEMLLAIPEHQVPLPGGTTASQSDIFVLARAQRDLICITIEGKVSEPFGPTVREWLSEASPGKKNIRLPFLSDTLDIDLESQGHLRYQLVHRTASAVIEARRFGATTAAMIVHSFSQAHQWLDDYKAFAAVFGTEAEIGRLTRLKELQGIDLYIGWATGDAMFLSR